MLFPRPKTSPWGDYRNTWQLPKRITGEEAKRLSSTKKSVHATKIASSKELQSDRFVVLNTEPESNRVRYLLIFLGYFDVFIDWAMFILQNIPNCLQMYLQGLPIYTRRPNPSTPAAPKSQHFSQVPRNPSTRAQQFIRGKGKTRH